MAIQEKFPSIRPSLNLDFANTKALDPRIDFTRASTATYYDGKTFAKAEENLLLNSQVPLGLGWYSIDGRTGATEAEVLVNGDFSNGLDGWAQSTTGVLSIESEKLRIEGTGASNFHGVKYVLAIPSGTYQIQLDVSIFAGNGVVKVFTGWTGGTELFRFGLKSGLNTFSITTSASFYLWIQANNSISFSALIDNVSVKPLYADNKISPDGTATAATAIALGANATFIQTVTAVAGDHTFSVWLRRKTGTGTVEITAGSGTWAAQSITSSWARYSVTQTLSDGSRSPGVRITTLNDEVEIWGAQLEQRSQVTAYTPTTTQPITNYIPVLQTVEAGVPRFDHDSVTGESLGLLIEESRTNLLTYSEQFDNAAWGKENITVTANSVVAPDGTPTADKFFENTSTGVHRFKRWTKISANTTYTASVYAKAAERRYFGLKPGVLGTTEPVFDLLTGTVVEGNGTIVGVGNGWYKCSLTFSSGAETTHVAFWTILNIPKFLAESYTGDGHSGIYLWGAQLEAGAFPTSYIKTEASQVTRSADNASMTGANFSSWYRADEGTLYAEASTRSSCIPFQIDSGTKANLIATRSRSLGASGAVVEINRNGIGQVSLPNGTFVATNKNAVAYQKNNVSVSLNGALIGTDTSVDIPVVNGAAFGTNRVGVFGGHIRKIAYYPARLSNTNLQALTT